MNVFNSKYSVFFFSTLRDVRHKYSVFIAEINAIRTRLKFFAALILFPRLVEGGDFVVRDIKPERGDSFAVLIEGTDQDAMRLDGAVCIEGWRTKQRNFFDECRSESTKRIPINSSPGNSVRREIPHQSPQQGGEDPTGKLRKVKNTSFWHSQSFVDFYSLVVGTLIGCAFAWWGFPLIFEGRSEVPWPFHPRPNVTLTSAPAQERAPNNETSCVWLSAALGECKCGSASQMN